MSPALHQPLQSSLHSALQWSPVLCGYGSQVRACFRARRRLRQPLTPFSYLELEWDGGVVVWGRAGGGCPSAPHGCLRPSPDGLGPDGKGGSGNRDCDGAVAVQVDGPGAGAGAARAGSGEGRHGGAAAAAGAAGHGRSADRPERVQGPPARRSGGDGGEDVPAGSGRPAGDAAAVEPHHRRAGRGRE